MSLLLVIILAQVLVHVEPAGGKRQSIYNRAITLLSEL